MTGRIRIVTDSVADIPDTLAQQWGIKVVPIYVLIGERTYRDDGSLDRKWFYANLDRMEDPPRTAAPSPDEILAAYRSLVVEGAEEIIGLFLSGKLSSVKDNAYLAGQRLENAQVHIVETGQVSMGIGWLAIAAAKAVAQGASVLDVVKLVEDMRRRTVVVGMLDSLEYLWRGGRVGWARAWLGDLLRVKPLISFYEGEATLLGRVRTHRRALQALAGVVRQLKPVEHIALLHSYVDAAVLTSFREILMDCLPEDIPNIAVTPVFGTHVGPRCMGAAVVSTRKSDIRSILE